MSRDHSTCIFLQSINLLLKDKNSISKWGFIQGNLNKEETKCILQAEQSIKKLTDFFFHYSKMKNEKEEI